MRNVIVQVEPRPGRQLWLAYEDGASGEVSIADMCGEEGVFSRFPDETFFRQVRIGERGRYLEWPGEIDLCADALRMELRARATQPAGSP